MGTAAHPLVIEVAINGARSRAHNPHVPLTAQEIGRDVDVCIAAGASIVHAHAGEPVVGDAGRHSSKPYFDAFEPVCARHPGLLFYPTIPGGGSLTIAERMAHIAELVDGGLVSLVPVDPGTMNYGSADALGVPPVHHKVYQTTFGDVDTAFRFCSERSLACTMSIFEPGFLQLALAHRAAGSLPPGSIVKFEFAARDRLFGLPPTAISLQAYLAMLDEVDLPWMVNLREGDLMNGLGEAVIRAGGHLRVGIEDYGGPRTPRNVDLVEEIAALGRVSGRRPATIDEARSLLALAS